MRACRQEFVAFYSVVGTIFFASEMTDLVEGGGGIDMVAMAKARSSGWVIMRGSGQPGRMDMIRSAIGITRRYHLSRATTTTANKHHECVLFTII